MFESIVLLACAARLLEERLDIAAHVGLAEAPPVCRKYPAVPGDNFVYTVALLSRILPWVLSIVSIIAVSVLANGAALPPVILAKILLLAIAAREIVPVDVIVPPVKPVPVATDVTANAQAGFADAPPVCKKYPDVLGANTAHAVEFL